MNDFIQNNAVGVITLKDILDLINDDRKLRGSKDIQHSKAMSIVLKMSKESPSFGEVSFFDTINLNNVKVQTYLLTKNQAIAVGGKLDTERLMLVINKVEELEKSQSQKVLTTSEQITLLAQGHQEIDSRINVLEHQVNNDIPLSSAQKHNIKQKVNVLVYQLKNNHNLHDDFIPKCYSRVWKKVKNHFIVSSYMEIPKSKFDELVSVVDAITIADVV